jgi:hypothetical protein
MEGRLVRDFWGREFILKERLATEVLLKMYSTMHHHSSQKAASAHISKAKKGLVQ